MQGPTPEDLARTAELIRTVQANAGARCATTGVPLGPHELLVNIAMGRKSAPMALAELAAAEGQALVQLRERVLSYIHARPCHRGAWQWASEQLGVEDGMNPPLSWDNVPMVEQPEVSSQESRGEHAFWDAGDMGCGDLVLQLRTRLKEMSARQVLRLRATDLGAPQDIPAWCGMTGNKLIKQESDQYWIQRKD